MILCWPKIRKCYQAAAKVRDGEEGELEPTGLVDQEVVGLEVTVAHAVAHQETNT